MFMCTSNRRGRGIVGTALAVAALQLVTSAHGWTGPEINAAYVRCVEYTEPSWVNAAADRGCLAARDGYLAGTPLVSGSLPQKQAQADQLGLALYSEAYGAAPCCECQQNCHNCPCRYYSVNGIMRMECELRNNCNHYRTGSAMPTAVPTSLPTSLPTSAPTAPTMAPTEMPTPTPFCSPPQRGQSAVSPCRPLPDLLPNAVLNEDWSFGATCTVAPRPRANHTSDGEFGTNEWDNVTPAVGRFTNAYFDYAEGFLYILNDWIYNPDRAVSSTCYNLFNAFTGDGQEQWEIRVYGSGLVEASLNGVLLDQPNVTHNASGAVGWGTSPLRPEQAHTIFELAFKAAPGRFGVQLHDPGPRYGCDTLEPEIVNFVGTASPESWPGHSGGLVLLTVNKTEFEHQRALTPAPTSPTGSGACGEGTAFDQATGMCLKAAAASFCKQGTKLDEESAGCVPDCRDIRRRGINCPSCKEQEAAAADGDDASSGTIMIIGIVVGGVLFLIAVVAVVFSQGTAPDTADMDKPRAMENVVYEAPNDDTNGYLTVSASRS